MLYWAAASAVANIAARDTSRRAGRRRLQQCIQVRQMAYTREQLDWIVQWLRQRAPKLMVEGCSICGASAAQFGVEPMQVPEFPAMLVAIACRSCGHIVLFNADAVLGQTGAQ